MTDIYLTDAQSHQQFISSNNTLLDWCAKKTIDTSRSSSNAEIISMYTGVVDQNWIRNFIRSIGYPIGPPSKLYYDNQATIKIFLANRVTPQDIPTNNLITDIHELHIRKTFKMVNTRSNMQLADLNSKPHGETSSGVSLTTPFYITSILLQVHNNTNYFNLISYMGLITSITTSIRKMRLNSR